MTRDETKKILMVIECSYPNWKHNGNLGFVVDIWNDDLLEYSYQDVYTALKVYKATNTSGFAPSVGQLIELMVSGANKEAMSELVAWDLVRKALENSSYHSEEEFNKLPEIIQKTVGSPSQLRSWGIDPDYNESVVSSNFMRAYKTMCEREKRDKKISPALKLAMEKSEQKMIEG